MVNCVAILKYNVRTATSGVPCRLVWLIVFGLIFLDNKDTAPLGGQCVISTCMLIIPLFYLPSNGQSRLSALSHVLMSFTSLYVISYHWIIIKVFVLFDLSFGVMDPLDHSLLFINSPHPPSPCPHHNPFWNNWSFDCLYVCVR